jgi:hypothetical protein
LALAAIIVFIRWFSGALGLEQGIDVNNQQQLLRVAAFFIISLVLLGVYTAAAFIKGFSRG